MVLRDRRVEVAVLETARGGILRRGLTVTRAEAAIVTNIAEDHFGEFGVSDLRCPRRGQAGGGAAGRRDGARGAQRRRPRAGGAAPAS